MPSTYQADSLEVYLISHLVVIYNTSGLYMYFLLAESRSYPKVLQTKPIFYFCIYLSIYPYISLEDIYAFFKQISSLCNRTTGNRGCIWWLAEFHPGLCCHPKGRAACPVACASLAPFCVGTNRCEALEYQFAVPADYKTSKNKQQTSARSSSPY